MKKLIPLAVIAMFGALSFVACKKSSSDPVGNYNCVCSSTSGGTTTYDTIPINNQKKSVATSACNQSTTTLGGGFSCKLQ